MTSLLWFALRAFVSILSDMVRFSDPHSHRQHTRAPRYSTTVAPNEAAQAKQLIMSQPDALNAKKKASHPHAFPQLSLSAKALVWMSRGALLTCAHVIPRPPPGPPSSRRLRVHSRWCAPPLSRRFSAMTGEMAGTSRALGSSC